MSTVKQPTIMLRESPHQDIQPKVEVAAVGQRRQESSPWSQVRAEFPQEPQRFPQVFKDVGAENEIEGPSEMRDGRIQVGWDECRRLGEAIRDCPGLIDADDIETF